MPGLAAIACSNEMHLARGAGATMRVNVPTKSPPIGHNLVLGQPQLCRVHGARMAQGVYSTTIITVESVLQ